MYVVNGNCLGCKFGDCIQVCPVKECFKEGKNMVVIDPELCIECGLCVSACPANAIAHDCETELKWIEHNAEFSKVWPPVIERVVACQDAQEMIDVPNKEEVFDKKEPK